jgi:hypothetical protein
MKVVNIDYDWKKLHTEKNEAISFILDQAFEKIKNIIPVPDNVLESSKKLQETKDKISEIDKLIKKSSEVQISINEEVNKYIFENKKIKAKILELI